MYPVYFETHNCRTVISADWKFGVSEHNPMSQIRTMRKSNKARPHIGSTEVFSIMGSKRRQYLITYLTEIGSASLGELAEYIATRERDLTQERYERICTELYHVHLPRLENAGILRYDYESENVQLVVSESDLSPFIELTVLE